MPVEHVAQKHSTKNVQLNTVLGDYKRKINEIIDNLGVGGGSGGEAHASTHEAGGDDTVNHDSLVGFLATEHFLQSAITTVGTIDTGVWEGDSIGNAYLAGIDQNLLQASIPTFAGLILDGNLSIRDLSELRLYDNGNYVGFKPPVLDADQIWVLPNADGDGNDVLGTDGSGNLIWITGTSLGNVIAASDFGVDNRVIRSDGTGKGVQASGVVIDDSGRVGIGAIPSNALSVEMSIAGDWVAEFKQGYAVAGASYGVNIQGGTNASDKAFRVGNQAGAELFTILGSGRVGIGTSTPGGTVHIWSGDAGLITNENFADELILECGGDGGMSIQTPSGSVGRILFQCHDNDAVARIDAFYNSGSEYLSFLVNDGEKMRITDAGLVDVNGSLRVSGYLCGSTSSGYIIFYGDIGSSAYMMFDDSGNLKLSSASSRITGGTTLWLEAGTSGIHSTTIYNDSTGSSANMYISGGHKIYKGVSAKKYKEKIADLELDSSLIYNLLPRSFNSRCKDDSKGRRFVGLIADEVEKVYPEIIDYNKDNEAEDYDSRMLMTLMLAETQHHEVKIVDHETRIKALEAKFDN